MKHPTYADGDPKAGQPVLFGETFYDDLGKPFTCEGVHADGSVITKWKGGEWAEKYSGPFFSHRPAPAIEPCVCGSNHVGQIDQRVGCHDCGRVGQRRETWAACVTSWNADMRILKFAGIYTPGCTCGLIHRVYEVRNGMSRVYCGKCGKPYACVPTRE